MTTTHDIDLSTAEAFAAIPLAAVCCDRDFRPEEADVIRAQLLSRTPFRSMEPYAFGVLFSDLLRRYRENDWQLLVAQAAPLLSQQQRRTAYALACQLIHCDREVNPSERSFLEVLAKELQLPLLWSQQVIEVCELLHQDCLAPGSTT